MGNRNLSELSQISQQVLKTKIFAYNFKIDDLLDSTLNNPAKSKKIHIHD